VIVCVVYLLRVGPPTPPARIIERHFIYLPPADSLHHRQLWRGELLPPEKAITAGRHRQK
jgi:hypothetical protein